MTENEERARRQGFSWRTRSDPRAPWGYVGPYYYNADGEPVLSPQLTDGEKAAFAVGVSEAYAYMRAEGLIKEDDH